jgi:hypothetical protein
LNHRRVASSILWLIHWDIGLDKNRFRFYRALKRLQKEMGLYGEMSSMSVMITYDEKLARRVFDLASRFTQRVHIYRAVEIA